MRKKNMEGWLAAEAIFGGKGSPPTQCAVMWLFNSVKLLNWFILVSGLESKQHQAWGQSTSVVQQSANAPKSCKFGLIIAGTSWSELLTYNNLFTKT